MSFVRKSFINKSLLRPPLNILSNEKGNVLVFVALLTVALFGMTTLVVDGGMLYRERNILQKTVDAAALAGVQELDGKEKSTEEAKKVAKEYVELNYDGKDNKILPENVTCNCPEGYDGTYYEITVTADIDTNLWFARVLQDKWKLPLNVSATATAGKMPGYGPMPIGVYYETWEKLQEEVPPLPALGDIIVVKAKNTGLDGEILDKPFVDPSIPGWFTYVGPDKNKSDLKDYIAEGIPGCYGIGSHFYELNGNVQGIKKELQERDTRASNGCTKHPGGCPVNPDFVIQNTSEGYVYKSPLGSADDVFKMYQECPRLWLLPIVKYEGGKDFYIKGFIIGYLKSWNENSNQIRIELWYLGKLTLAEGDPCLLNHRYARLIH